MENVSIEKPLGKIILIKVSEYPFKENKNTLKTYKCYYIHISIISN